MLRVFRLRRPRIIWSLPTLEIVNSSVLIVSKKSQSSLLPSSRKETWGPTWYHQSKILFSSLFPTTFPFPPINTSAFSLNTLSTNPLELPPSYPFASFLLPGLATNPPSVSISRKFLRQVTPLTFDTSDTCYMNTQSIPYVSQTARNRDTNRLMLIQLTGL